MPARQITDAAMHEAYDLVERCGSFQEASRQTGIPIGTVKSRLFRACAAFNLPTPAAARQQAAQPIPFPPQVPHEPTTGLAYDDAWAKWQQTIGQTAEHYRRPALPANTLTERILVIPDLHVPFHEPELLARTLEVEADRCIIAGDLSDAYSFSRFVLYEHVPYRAEWAQVTLALEQIASRYPKVDLIIGNHDGRLEKQLRTRLTQDMVDALVEMTGGTLCPLTALAKHYPNVTVAKHITDGGHSVDWFSVCGDAIILHAEKFSRVPASALRGVEEWLADQSQAFNLPDYRLVCLAHTHQMGWFPWRADKVLVEIGCLAKVQGYMTTPRIGGRPQRRGYVTFTQHGGKTDLNSVRLHCFDLEM